MLPGEQWSPVITAGRDKGGQISMAGKFRRSRVSRTVKEDVRLMDGCTRVQHDEHDTLSSAEGIVSEQPAGHL